MSLFNNLKRELKNKKIYFILISVFILIYSLAVYFAMYSSEDKSVINIVSTLSGQGGMAGGLACIYLYIPILFFGINSYMVNSERKSFIGFAVVGLLVVILKNAINNSGILGLIIILIPYIHF